MIRIFIALIVIFLAAPASAQPCEGFGNAMDELEAQIAQTRTDATQQPISVDQTAEPEIRIYPLTQPQENAPENPPLEIVTPRNIM